MGVRLIALSADRPEKLRDFRNAENLGYDLYSDARLEAARAFGLAWQVGDAELERLRGFGIDLEDASGETHHQLPVPAVYLVDAERVVRFRYYDADYKVRLGAATLLDEARALTRAEAAGD